MSLKKYKLALFSTPLFSSCFLLISNFCYKSRTSFYWLLAGLISLTIIVSSLLGLSLLGAEQSTFDTLMKIRWSSPKPSQEIVILDIDEKSLAKLAPSLGRWPWKREVMAEVLSEIEASGAQSIIFNVLITDTDIANKQSDAILNDIAGASKIVAFPLVRLPQENDQKSQYHVSQLPGAILTSKLNDPTIAIILPGMLGMQKSMGISNLDTDPDGILRQYSINRVENYWIMPTLIGKALELANVKSNVSTDSSFLINWRNKKGSYQRISFSDYIDTLGGSSNLKSDVFKGKHVIIGASAAGISNPKATSASALTDDNEILATALDDTVNNTNLHPLASWIITILAIAFVSYLAYLFNTDNASDEADIIFILIEVLSIAVMFIGISYTNYFIDITPIATYGLAFFTISKIHQGLLERVIKGSPEHLGELAINKPQLLAIFTFKKESFKRSFLKKQFHKMVKVFGDKSVFLCFDVFEGDSILSSLEDIGCLVVLDVTQDKTRFLEKLQSTLINDDQAFFEYSVHKFPKNFENNDKLLEYISQKILFEVSKKIS
jgi:CHASE2 domain-containing sensor protein